MQQILALDIGDSRIGIAKADAMGILVKPYKTVKKEELFLELQALKSQYEIKTLVIGLPVCGDGELSEQALKIESFAEKLQERYPDLEICFEDERYSSKEAQARLRETGVKLTEVNKSLIDAYAAAIILESYFLNLSSQANDLDIS
jgi:putative holliday junction resolvase